MVVVVEEFSFIPGQHIGRERGGRERKSFAGWFLQMATASAKQEPQDRFAGAMESLMVLSESMQQASSLLADEDPAEEAPNQAAYSFLNVVALGNVVCSPFALHLHHHHHLQLVLPHGWKLVVF